LTTGPKYKIEEGTLGTSRLVTVSGEIDLASSPALERALTEEPDGTVIADLSEVGFIDSTGLRSLMTAQEAVAAADGRLMLVFADGPVERILGLTRLSDRFEIFPDTEAASRAVV
jgi:anti-sigma B factor antagonist